MGLPAKYVKGFTFGTLVIEQKYYLKYLMDELTKTGSVRFEQRRVNSLEELLAPSVSSSSDAAGIATTGNYDAVINCTGLGAFGVVDDKEMYPIRGQVLRVKAPWMKSVWGFGSSYIIPNVDTVVLGGTTQKGNWNANVSIEDTKCILEGVCAVFPSLRDAPIVSHLFGSIFRLSSTMTRFLVTMN